LQGIEGRALKLLAAFLILEPRYQRGFKTGAFEPTFDLSFLAVVLLSC